MRICAKQSRIFLRIMMNIPCLTTLDARDKMRIKEYVYSFIVSKNVQGRMFIFRNLRASSFQRNGLRTEAIKCPARAHRLKRRVFK